MEIWDWVIFWFVFALIVIGINYKLTGEKGVIDVIEILQIAMLSVIYSKVESCEK